SNRAATVQPRSAAGLRSTDIAATSSSALLAIARACLATSGSHGAAGATDGARSIAVVLVLSARGDSGPIGPRIQGSHTSGVGGGGAFFGSRALGARSRSHAMPSSLRAGATEQATGTPMLARNATGAGA